MIGLRIREARKQLGISQQQLAGSEMTRVFISLVESGKCNPSPETLRIIAQRLGKPVEYFLQQECPDDDLIVVTTLLTSAEQDLEADDSPEVINSAKRKLVEVLKCIQFSDYKEIEAKALSLLIKAHRLSEAWESVVEECERALACHQALNDLRGQAKTYKDLGDAYYRQEEFPKALEAYKKATLFSAGLKRMQEFNLDVLTYTGSTLYRLGQYEEALTYYKKALAECSPSSEPERWAKVAMSLGWTMFASGELEAAREWTTKAATRLLQCHHPDAVLAQHNLAIIEASRGNRERAFGILQRCLKTYTEQGRITKQASVLEDLACYWMDKGDVAKAEQLAWRAIDLLDLADNGILRGRLYRVLGTIARQNGDIRLAQTMLRVSIDLLRRIKVQSEVTKSLKALESLPSVEPSSTSTLG